MEVLEFSLPLTDNQKLFSLFLHFKGIFLVLLEIHVLVLSETKCWEHSRIASGSHALRITHPGNNNWLRWESTGLSSSKGISSRLIIPTAVSLSWFVTTWSSLFYTIALVSGLWILVFSFTNRGNWKQTLRFHPRRRRKITWTRPLIIRVGDLHEIIFLNTHYEFYCCFYFKLFFSPSKISSAVGMNYKTLFQKYW